MSTSSKYYRYKQLPATPRPDSREGPLATSPIRASAARCEPTFTPKVDAAAQTQTPTSRSWRTQRLGASAISAGGVRSALAAAQERRNAAKAEVSAARERRNAAKAEVSAARERRNAAKAEVSAARERRNAAKTNVSAGHRLRMPWTSFGRIASPRNDSVFSSSRTATAFGRVRTKGLSKTKPPIVTALGRAKPPPPEAKFDVQMPKHPLPKPFVSLNGRTYNSDPSLPYPLPVDLPELHRQSLRTLLLFQLFGGPICSPVYANKAPKRVLEVGCGAAFWSMMCYRYYAQRGHRAISFTGVDVAPLAPGANSGRATGRSRNQASASSSSSPSAGLGNAQPDKDMKWRFVQHDLRRVPWPFADGEFDMIMVKDMSLASPLTVMQDMMDEYLRILAPGGIIEIWESDHAIRMVRPHVRQPVPAFKASGSRGGAGAQARGAEDDLDTVASLGAYTISGNTPLSAPLNNYLVEYNAWMAKALEARCLPSVPCTLMGPALLQESELLTGMGSRRLALPLSEVRWEREGVGGVITRDGKSYIETNNKSRGPASRNGKEPAFGKPLGRGQAAVRHTALLTVIQMARSMGPCLRKVNGKTQDEWDNWLGKMMIDLVNNEGTKWGECLETGAWWAQKRST